RDFHVTGVQTCALPILGGFNRFYWTFFKYGVILFLLKKILHSIKSRKIPRDDMNSGKSTDLAQENMTLTVKSGITTYMVNIFRKIGRASCRERGSSTVV